MTKQQIKLLNENFSWCKSFSTYLIKKYKIADKDEALSQAYFAYTDACIKFIPGNNSFKTYAYYKIKGAIIDYLRKQKNISYKKTSFISCEVKYKYEHLQAIKVLLSCLNSREIDIINEVYFNDKTLKDIAEKYNCCPPSISKVKTRALKKLKYFSKQKL